MSDELAYVSTTELAERIRSRDLSPVEVVDACIERIEARDPSLNAFVYKGYDDARIGRSRPSRQSRPAGRSACCTASPRR